MKSKRSIVSARREKIIDAIRQFENVSVEDLSKALEVSPLTIRRDLQYFEDKNIIERYYGGARIVKDFDDVLNDIEYRKNIIAKYAASFVEDGDSIFINTSSTALLLIKYLEGKRVTVITNNGKAIFSEYDMQISIVLTGGELRNPKESMTGDFAINNLMRVTANKAFLGCSGITSQTGITTSVLPEVAINEIMLSRCSGSKFIMADYTKVGIDQNFVSGSIENIDYLITDDKADREKLDEIREKGIKTIVLDNLEAK